MRAPAAMKKLFVLFGCLVSCVLSRPALAEEVVALHPLRGLGVDGETVGNLESILQNELGRVPGMRLVERARMRDLLEREGMECDGRDSCLAEVARHLGAAMAVYGVVGGLGDSYTIALKAVAADGEDVRARVDLRVGGEREVLIDGIRAGAYQLLRSDLYVGSLQLELPVEGAEVYIDGELVGSTPLREPVGGLEPGQRALKIVKTGFRDFDRFMEIRFQRTSVVTVDLETSVVEDIIYEEVPAGDLVELEPIPIAETRVEEQLETEPEPPEPEAEAEDYADTATAPSEARAGSSGLRIGSYALLAAGGLSLAGGGYFGLSARSQESSLAKAFESAGPTSEHIEDWERAHSTARTANTLYAAGGAAAAAGLALLIMDVVLDEGGGEAASGSADIAIFPASSMRPGLTLTVSW